MCEMCRVAIMLQPHALPYYQGNLLHKSGEGFLVGFEVETAGSKMEPTSVSAQQTALPILTLSSGLTKESSILLERIQYRAAKFVKGKREDGNDTIKELKWETLENRRRKTRITSLYRAHLGQKAWVDITARLEKPTYYRLDHDFKIKCRKQKTDVGRIHRQDFGPKLTLESTKSPFSYSQSTLKIISREKLFWGIFDFGPLVITITSALTNWSYPGTPPDTVSTSPLYPSSSRMGSARDHHHHHHHHHPDLELWFSVNVHSETRIFSPSLLWRPKADLNLFKSQRIPEAQNLCGNECGDDDDDDDDDTAEANFIFHIRSKEESSSNK
ncbi:hypothetical protein ANN_05838 [Periplaneta americana]|uniref:Uncharacterized protein n=1 Tax=Periplaneta americana TaxID=6978 RepID=A0ABQ8TDP5_PERAM|nr:hypothetical protein ANN_05838 [Periplaneta americana]